MIKLKNETQLLKKVIVGTAKKSGGTPSLFSCYDPISKESIEKGIYPNENSLSMALDHLADTLKKHNIEVIRPDVIENCNQIFTRDIACVIEDRIFISNIIPDRAQEIRGIQSILDKIPDSQKIYTADQNIHFEGGDIILYNDIVFIGICTREDYKDCITARTNIKAVSYFRRQFPYKKIIPLELPKSNTDPYTNILHLDCCFQPVGKDLAIVSPNGFIKQEDFKKVCSFFKKENIFLLTAYEQYELQSNIISIHEKLIVSDYRFKRLNQWLRSKEIEIITIDYSSISRQGGLFRCSTLPLLRT